MLLDLATVCTCWASDCSAVCTCQGKGCTGAVCTLSGTAGLLGLGLHLPPGSVLLPRRQQLGWVPQTLLLHCGQLLVSVLLRCRQLVVVVLLQALLLLLRLVQGLLDPAGECNHL